MGNPEKRRTYLVTGGAGFIGSNLVRHLLRQGNRVVNIDKLTYAADPQALEEISALPGYEFVRADICDQKTVASLFDRHLPERVMHLAAESHVDRSIAEPLRFVATNVMGTAVMLQAAREFWEASGEEMKKDFRFIHVSTDEVFGTLEGDARFTEDSAYDPHSPYAASKAAADHLVRAWGDTYGLPVIVTNSSNNYGPWQFPEKLIPLMIFSALRGQPLPVYGDGGNVRDWLHVEDHCRALDLVSERGVPGETYLIGGGCERKNIELVRQICGYLDELRPRPDGVPYESQIAFVKDRPAHDHRYALDFDKIRRTLRWEPRLDMNDALKAVVGWYEQKERSGSQDRLASEG